MTAEPKSIIPRPPAHVAPYVEILGVDDAIAFLLNFGGSERHVARDPARRADIEAVIGHDKAEALAAAAPRLPRRHPLAKPWMAKVFRTKGLSVDAIARKLRGSNVAVRAWLKDDAPPRDPPAQPDLFD